MQTNLFGTMDVESIAAHTLLAMAIVVAAGCLGGQLLRRFGQPVVLGEIIAGICLGSTVLGRLPGNLTERLFPTEVRPFLRVAAELGLVLFMFMVGLELDPETIRTTGRKALTISLSSIVVPFALGLVVLAPLLYPAHKVVGNELVRYTPFALFIAISMCVTAFPVLARILAERQMLQMPLGTLLISAAAVDDVVAYSLLAVVLAVAASSGSASVAVHLLGLAVLVTVLARVVRPLMAKTLVPRFDRERGVSPELLAALFVGLLVTAYATYLMGLATLVGAFLFGLLIPREGAAGLPEGVAERISGVATTLLLPVFFVVTGLGVDVGGLGWSGLLPTLIVIAVACVGKFAGATGAARSVGVPRRQALAIGVMMNTRGLAELVILNIGRDAGILDDHVFTMLVIMAVVTTFMAGPLLKRVYPQRWIEREIATARRTARGDGVHLLVCVDDVASAERLVDLAIDAARSWERPCLHLVRLTPAASGTSEASAVELSELTRSMAFMDGLRRKVEGAGVSSLVTVRATDDLVRDAVALVRDDPVLVIAGWSPPLADRVTHRPLLAELLHDAGADVVVVAGARPSSEVIVVEAGANRSAAAAVELAARLASSRSSTLIVDGGPRAVARTVRHLQAAGFGDLLPADGEPTTADAATCPTRVLAAPNSLRELDAAATAAIGEFLLVRAANHERPSLHEAARTIHVHVTDASA